MPKIQVSGTTITYETWGEGAPIVLTPQGWFARNPFVYILAGRLSKTHKVLLWDRPNAGASDIAIEDTPSEPQLWADRMHEMLHQLGMAPAYFAGSSMGSVFSLFMAHRYPADVRAIISIDPPGDDDQLNDPLISARYFEFMEIARTKGMAAVIEHSQAAWSRIISAAPLQKWDSVRKGIAESIALNPANRERLLAFAPEEFATIMARWGQWNTSALFHRAQLSDAECQTITTPALFFPGTDELHPPHTAQQLAKLLPNARLVDYSHHFTQAEIQCVQGSDAYMTQNAFLKLPFIEDFLRQQV